MKILMLTTNSSLMDGINRHILAIASHVNRLDGCEVAVCTVFPRAELADALEAEGVTTYSLNASNGHDIHVLWRFYKVMNLDQMWCMYMYLQFLNVSYWLHCLGA